MGLMVRLGGAVLLAAWVIRSAARWLMSPAPAVPDEDDDEAEEDDGILWGDG